MYLILGGQARERWVIVGDGVKSSQTQEVFRRIVWDTTVQSDTSFLTSNMRKAIRSTNVVLNMAISPGVIVVPSNMRILNEMLPGYNNIITSPTEGTKFGSNPRVNYVGTQPKEVKTKHLNDQPSSHLDTLGDHKTDPSRSGDTPLSLVENHRVGNNVSPNIDIAIAAIRDILAYMLVKKLQ